MATVKEVGVRTAASRAAVTSAPIAPDAETTGRRPAQTRTSKTVAAAVADVTTAEATTAAAAAAAAAVVDTWAAAAALAADMKAPVWEFTP